LVIEVENELRFAASVSLKDLMTMIFMLPEYPQMTIIGLGSVLGLPKTP
jgi:hypothetical protein